MKKIGITGGIASGKTIVSQYIRQKGYVVIDCDEIAHDELKKPEVIAMIRDAFGDSVVSQQQINRANLGKIIFSDPEKRTQLNEMIHPRVIDEVNRRVNSLRNHELVFIDVPLLYEAHMETMMDHVIVVYVNLETQLRRLMARDGINESVAIPKIASQMSLEEKRQRADFVVNNSHTVMSTFRQVGQIIRRILHEI